jgi:selenocysteine lyase/cysteine desulfurase
MNWAAIRNEFPALRDWTYLNSATFGQTPRRTSEAVARHFVRRDNLASTDFLSWFDDVDHVRALLGRLINCNAEDIGFTMNTAAAISLLLGGIEWRSGDRIVTLSNDFPNQHYYAATLSTQGVELVEMDEIASLPARTRAVVLSTVSYSNGYRPDLQNISELAHGAGALLYIDATQSLGALRLDVASLRPTILAVDPYKWMFSPNGATFFYVAPEARVWLKPNTIGWRSDKGWRSVDGLLLHGTPQFPEGAERYEGGMLNFPSLYGLQASVEMILEIGPEAIERRVLDLAGKTAEILRRRGATIAHENTNIVAARFPDRDAVNLARNLAEQKIIVSARYGNLRVSPHFYNDESDLGRLDQAL